MDPKVKSAAVLGRAKSRNRIPLERLLTLPQSKWGLHCTFKHWALVLQQQQVTVAALAVKMGEAAAVFELPMTLAVTRATRNDAAAPAEAVVPPHEDKGLLQP